MNKQNKKGFTLTEMIVVIAIIGILAAVLIPSIIGYINHAKKSNDTQSAASMTDEIERYCIQNGIDQDLLIGTDVRTILIGKGYDLEPSKDDWTYVYNSSSKIVEIVDIDEVSPKTNGFTPNDPTNYNTNLYLVGEGENDIEEAIKLLINYKSESDFNSAKGLVSGNEATFIEQFNPESTLYVNNIRSLSAPQEINFIVYTVGTFNIPNLTNDNLIAANNKVFRLPAIIQCVNNYTIEKMDHIFENVSEFEDSDNYPEIDLSNLEITDDQSNPSNPTFTFGDLVENTKEQSISIDIVGYTREWDDDGDGIYQYGEEIIRLVYEVTVIYFDDNGIVAKGNKLMLSNELDPVYAESIKLTYSEIELVD